MIQTTELRIGNFVICEGMESEVSEITVSETTLIHPAYENEIECYLFDIKPIPLTEDWLLNFGFELDEDLGDQMYYKKSKWVVCFDHEELTFNHQLMSAITCLIYDNICFQHVHQLQNLYFALCGEELTIK